MTDHRAEAERHMAWRAPQPITTATEHLLAAIHDAVTDQQATTHTLLGEVLALLDERLPRPSKDETPPSAPTSAPESDDQPSEASQGAGEAEVLAGWLAGRRGDQSGVLR